MCKERCFTRHFVSAKPVKLNVITEQAWFMKKCLGRSNGVVYEPTLPAVSAALWRLCRCPAPEMARSTHPHIPRHCSLFIKQEESITPAALHRADYFSTVYHSSLQIKKKKSRNHVKILGARRETWSKFENEDIQKFFPPYKLWGTAVAQWLRCCATNRKVAGSIPAGAIGIFHWHKILPIAPRPWGRLSL